MPTVCQFSDTILGTQWSFRGKTDILFQDICLTFFTDLFLCIFSFCLSDLLLFECWTSMTNSLYFLFCFIFFCLFALPSDRISHLCLSVFLLSVFFVVLIFFISKILFVVVIFFWMFYITAFFGSIKGLYIFYRRLLLDICFSTFWLLF